MIENIKEEIKYSLKRSKQFKSELKKIWNVFTTEANKTSAIRSAGILSLSQKLQKNILLN